MIKHVDRRVTVTLDACTNPPIISVSNNPHIPAHGIGTITWIVGNEGDPFTFSEFKWCEDEDFLHTPIIDGHVIVTAVTNPDKKSEGDWGYRLCVKAPDGKRHWSMECSAIPKLKERKAASISAAMASGPVIINDGV